jgi:FkbM family methyltransferase
MRIEQSYDGYKWIIRENYKMDSVGLSKGELCLLKTLYSLSDKNKIFVDVGANIGYYTIRMAKHFKKVIAIEPAPPNLHALYENIRLNNIDNVEVLPIAVGDKNEKKILYFAEAGSTLLGKNVAGYERSEEFIVDVKKLDDVIEKADVIKIDVEGYDLEVVRGMRRLLSQKPIVIIEHHDLRGYPIYAKDIIQKIYMKEYFFIEFLDLHCIYFPLDYNDKNIKTALSFHWKNYVLNNIKSGKEWYFGLPYQWWWGMTALDFIEEIENHVIRDDEPEWLNIVKKTNICYEITEKENEQETTKDTL